MMCMTLYSIIQRDLIPLLIIQGDIKMYAHLRKIQFNKIEPVLISVFY